MMRPQLNIHNMTLCVREAVAYIRVSYTALLEINFTISILL